MVRAVIADDSGVVRAVLSEILESGGVEVVATASNGREAVEAIGTHEPDVATIDVEMPVMNGIEAIERVMETTPTPIIVISALTERGADATFEALEAGAVDFVTKPDGQLSVELWAQQGKLVELVEAAASVDPSILGDDSDRSGPTDVAPSEEFPNEPTLVIGASTGGPRVVERLLESLPVHAGLRILVVQHMQEHYTGRFAERLDGRSAYEIRESTSGDTIGPGEALLAKGGYHLEVVDWSDGRLTVAHDDGPQLHNVKPAIDVTMETAAATVTGNLVGVALTGMGADGAAGMSAIKEAGGKTIAQDEATSRVFGIPRAAIETGDVDMVLPEDRIAEGITNAFRGWSA